jgi:hypothetical protein
MLEKGQSVMFTQTVYDSGKGITVERGSYGTITKVLGDDVWVQVSQSSGWLGSDKTLEIKATRWDLQ